MREDLLWSMREKKRLESVGTVGLVFVRATAEGEGKVRRCGVFGWLVCGGAERGEGRWVLVGRWGRGRRKKNQRGRGSRRLLGEGIDLGFPCYFLFFKPAPILFFQFFPLVIFFYLYL
jgi:hypothetical protein